MKRALVAATIAIAATSAMAANWKHVGTSRDDNVYVNTETIRYQSDGSVALMVSHNPKNGSAAQVSAVHIDCQSDRFRVALMPNGFGNWDFVPPGSVVSTLQRLYCK